MTDTPATEWAGAPTFAVTARLHELFARVERDRGRHPSPVAHTRDGAVLGMRPAEVRRFVGWFNSILGGGVRYRLPTPDELAGLDLADVAAADTCRVWSDDRYCEALAVPGPVPPDRFQVSAEELAGTVAADLDAFEERFGPDLRVLAYPRRLRELVTAGGTPRATTTVAALNEWYSMVRARSTEMPASWPEAVTLTVGMVWLVHPAPITVPSAAHRTGRREQFRSEGARREPPPELIRERWWEIRRQLPWLADHYPRNRSPSRAPLPLDTAIRRLAGTINERISGLLWQTMPFDRESVRRTRVALAALTSIAEVYNAESLRDRTSIEDVSPIAVAELWQWIAELITVERCATMTVPATELLVLTRCRNDER